MSISDRNTNAANPPSDSDGDDGAFPEIPVRPRSNGARNGDAPARAGNGDDDNGAGNGAASAAGNGSDAGFVEVPAAAPRRSGVRRQRDGDDELPPAPNGDDEPVGRASGKSGRRGFLGRRASDDGRAADRGRNGRGRGTDGERTDAGTGLSGRRSQRSAGIDASDDWTTPIAGDGERNGRRRDESEPSPTANGAGQSDAETGRARRRGRRSDDAGGIPTSDSAGQGGARARRRSRRDDADGTPADDGAGQSDSPTRSVGRRGRRSDDDAAVPASDSANPSDTAAGRRDDGAAIPTSDGGSRSGGSAGGGGSIPVPGDGGQGDVASDGGGDRRRGSRRQGGDADDWSGAWDEARDGGAGRRRFARRKAQRREKGGDGDPDQLVTDSDAIVDDDPLLDEDLILGEDVEVHDVEEEDGLEVGASYAIEDDEPDDEDLLDELIFNHRRNRWEHPATRSWWNDRAERWEQKTGAPAPPAWTPPSLAMSSQSPRPRRPKIKKLRLLLMLSGFGVLAAISTLFGMLMAVASDLPALENRPVERNSLMLDHAGNPLGVMTGKDSRILLTESQIPAVMKHAIISIEDRRFYENDGVDLKAVGRALYQDVLSGGQAVQGGSTITMQFVKNAMRAQKQRTMLQKVREAALAYHLTRKWTKEKILKEYLNSIYFGNGAYGIESAARTYFRWNHPGCGNHGGAPRCATVLKPAEAALIAGVVSSPSGYDPVAHPQAARKRRNHVLRNMLDQRYVTRAQYASAIATPIPREKDIHPPRADTDYPYFASWVRQQVVDKMGSRKAYGGGLRIKTTLDVDLQRMADNAINQWIPPRPGGPSAALVALDNRTGQVRAMVGGASGSTKEERLARFAERPFNLATQGQRQPGSIFKPFVLAAALQNGTSPDSTWESKKLTITVPGTGGREKFVVNNYEDNYAGVSTLRNALTFSDNSVFVQVGMRTGTKKISRLISRMGVRTPVSRNYAVALGAPKAGVNVLDMAHAYQTFATGGRLRYGRLSPGASSGGIPGPSGIEEIREPVAPGSSKYRAAKLPGGDRAVDKTVNRRVLPKAIADQTTSIMTTVLKKGSGKRADLGRTFAAGKTGTTENYGDAWFAGFTKDYTVVVWVGYPDGVRPMKPPAFSFRGDPVAGGTYPASIWHTFLQSALQRDANRRSQSKSKDGDDDELPETTTTPNPTAQPASPTTPDGDDAADETENDGGGNGDDDGGGNTDRPPTQGTPQEPQPQPQNPTPPATGSPPTGGAPAAPGGAVAPTP